VSGGAGDVSQASFCAMTPGRYRVRHGRLSQSGHAEIPSATGSLAIPLNESNLKRSTSSLPHPHFLMI